MRNVCRRIQFLWWPKGDEKDHGGGQGEACRPEEELFVVHHAISAGELTLEGNKEPFGSEISKTQDE